MQKTYTKLLKENILRYQSPLADPDKLCRNKEFTVIRYSIGTCEEFVTISPSKVSNVERTPGSMSCIYHELYSRKDRGWQDSGSTNCTNVFETFMHDLAESEIDSM
nr:hypothetical protein [Tanacetum cinerariifolium]